MGASVVLSYSVSAQAAGKRVAIIEEGTVASAKLEEFDLLELEQEFVLGPNEVVVIGYMTSCTREKITGGTVTIGDKKSSVVGGKVVQEDVGQCGKPGLKLTAAESQQSGTLSFRGDDDLPKTTYSLNPIFRSRGGDTLFVEIVPMEGTEKAMKLKSENGRIDLATEKLMLKPGHQYLVKSGETTITLKVAPSAKAGGGIVERIVLVN